VPGIVTTPLVVGEREPQARLRLLDVRTGRVTALSSAGADGRGCARAGVVRVVWVWGSGLVGADWEP
jgi:hypothetical protein